VRTDSNDLENMKISRDQALKKAQEELQKRQAAKDREKEKKALEEAKNAINGRGEMPASVMTTDGVRGNFSHF
jgi:Skp family chaperone for outer membrane proteins